MTDLPRVKKIYKLNNAGFVNARPKGDAVNGEAGLGDEGKELEILILGSMALRGSTN